jgi:hypothetical protein
LLRFRRPQARKLRDTCQGQKKPVDLKLKGLNVGMPKNRQTEGLRSEDHKSWSSRDKSAGNSEGQKVRKSDTKVAEDPKVKIPQGK